MCVICGCNTDSDSDSEPGPVSVPPEETGFRSSPVPAETANGDLYYGASTARSSVPGMSEARSIQIEGDVLGENKRLANRNRAHFVSHGVTALNLVSSPGSGKTTLLCASIEALKVRRPGLRLAVIEGDQQTTVDADRIRKTGASAIQVNTGRGCHLDAQMVGDAFARLDLHASAHHGHADDSLLFIENVGNLVCPALWDLGENAKVVVLSVTEGDDKPLKYPDMFAAATLMIINKIDLLPHVSFDVSQCIAFARRVNPGIEVLLVSATTGAGMDGWLDWVLAGGAGGEPHVHADPASAVAASAGVMPRVTS
jgi:hydrogenase nickel incorporation protein HypB